MFNEPMPHETLRQAEDLFYRHDWTGLEMALLSVQQAHLEGVVIDTPDVHLYVWLRNRLEYIKGEQ